MELCATWIVECFHLMSRLIALLFVAFLPVALGKESIVESLYEYFAATPVCSVATIDEIAKTKDQVIVSLNIERSTREALSAMHRESRDDWLSLHCPYPRHDVWNGVDDVIIESVIPSSKLNLSCSQYFLSRFEIQKKTESSFRQRIKKLLGNL